MGKGNNYLNTSSLKYNLASVCVFVCMRVFRGGKSVILRLEVTVWIGTDKPEQKEKRFS